MINCIYDYLLKNFFPQGECHEMGCDHVLGSKKVFDLCGVCDGDNSSCENVITKFHRKLRRGQSN